jgi:hypothetical protein
MTISNETCDNIDEAVDRAAMPSVLNSSKLMARGSFGFFFGSHLKFTQLRTPLPYPLSIIHVIRL